MDFQQVALVAALVQAGTSLWELDEFVFRFLQLEHLHIGTLIDGASVEQELVRRDAEQRLGHLTDALLIEVLQILTGQKHGRLFLSDTLQAVSDILDGGRIGQPDIQLVQCSHGVAHGQELIGHEGQHIEEHGIADVLRCTEHSLHTEYQEAAGGDVGMTVEKLSVGALAHGVQAQQHLLQEFFGIELVAAGVVGLVLLLNQVIQVGENGIVCGAHPAEVGTLGDTKLLVQLGQHDLDGVDMGIAEILVGTEKVFQEGDVLCQQGAFAEGLRRVGGVGIAAIIPALGFQDIDHILSGHKVSEAAADCFAHFLLLMLCVQRDHGLAGFQKVQNQKLHEVALALTGVAKDEDISRGLVLISLIEVYQNVAAVFVFADIEALAVQLAGVVEGIQVRHGACRQYTLELCAEGIVATGTDTSEALLLTKQKSVHIQLGAHQFRQHIGLEQLEGVIKEYFAIS